MRNRASLVATDGRLASPSPAALRVRLFRLRGRTVESGVCRGSPKGVLWLVGVLVVLTLASGRPCLAQQGGPSRVLVSPVEQQEVAPTMRLVGTVRPQLRSVVASEIAGLVSELLAEEGDAVTKGQVLCRLRDTRLRFNQAEAVARQAEMAAVLVERIAEAEKARFEMERTARLWKSQQCSEKEQLDARADFEAAQGRTEQARMALEAQKAAALGLADDVARCEITAPFDGFVVSKQTEVGAWVDRGGAVVDMIALSTVRVRVMVPESVVSFCQVGETAQVDVEAIGRVYAGRIARVIPDADERARTLPVEIDIANPSGELKAGMFVRAAVPSGPKSRQFVVSKDAVVVRGPMSVVYLVQTTPQGAMAIPTPIQVLAEVVDHVAIAAPGLSPESLVVVRGNEYMFGPSPVIPIPIGQAGPPTGGAPGGPPGASSHGDQRSQGAASSQGGQDGPPSAGSHGDQGGQGAASNQGGHGSQESGPGPGPGASPEAGSAPASGQHPPSGSERPAGSAPPPGSGSPHASGASAGSGARSGSEARPAAAGSPDESDPPPGSGASPGSASAAGPHPGAASSSNAASGSGAAGRSSSATERPQESRPQTSQPS